MTPDKFRAKWWSETFVDLEGPDDDPWVRLDGKFHWRDLEEIVADAKALVETHAKMVAKMTTEKL